MTGGGFISPRKVEVAGGGGFISPRSKYGLRSRTVALITWPKAEVTGGFFMFRVFLASVMSLTRWPVSRVMPALSEFMFCTCDPTPAQCPHPSQKGGGSALRDSPCGGTTFNTYHTCLHEGISVGHGS